MLMETPVATPKRKASGSNPLRNVRHTAESFDLSGLSAFLFQESLSLSFAKEWVPYRLVSISRLAQPPACFTEL